MVEQQAESARVFIAWADGAIRQREVPAVADAGALLTFAGVVRPTEVGRSLLGLSYSSYDPMAERELRRIVEQAVAEHELLHAQITHSRGFVAAGEASLWVVVAAAHRKPALAAMDQIIDALKRDVPIWKMPIFADQDGADG